MDLKIGTGELGGTVHNTRRNFLGMRSTRSTNGTSIRRFLFLIFLLDLCRLLFFFHLHKFLFDLLLVNEFRQIVLVATPENGIVLLANNFLHLNLVDKTSLKSSTNEFVCLNGCRLTGISVKTRNLAREEINCSFSARFFCLAIHLIRGINQGLSAGSKAITDHILTIFDDCICTLIFLIATDDARGHQDLRGHIFDYVSARASTENLAFQAVGGSGTVH